MSKIFEELLKEAQENTAECRETSSDRGSKKSNVYLQKVAQDMIEGGIADNMDIEDFNVEQLAKGVAVELEHTNNFSMALEIAMDHLAEFPDYYDRLEEMEDEAKEDFGEEED